MNLKAIRQRVDNLAETNEPKDEVPQKGYPRLNERFLEIQQSLKNTEGEAERTELLMEDDSLCHVMETGRIGTYEKICQYAKKLQGKRVIDIGCAYGHQSEAFVNSGVDYVGVTNHKSHFYNRDRFDYIVGEYPCELPLQRGDIGISVLCLTWNCYLYEGEKTLHEQCAALQRDFTDCILYLPAQAVEVVSGYFSETTKLDVNLYHFKREASVPC